MLRLLVLLLLIVNLALGGWLLWGPGPQPGGDREPQRLSQQVNPNAVTVLAPQAASQALADAAAARRAAQAATTASAPSAPSAGSAASAATSAASSPSPLAQAEAPRCWEAGPLAASELPAAEKVLREVSPALPRWNAVRSERGGVYIVYMGKYADPALLAKKHDELRRINVEHTELKDAPALQPGFQLSRHEQRADADAALARVAQRGVKTARVVVLTAPVVVTQLRFENIADEALRARIGALQLPPGGLAFKPCAKT